MGVLLKFKVDDKKEDGLFEWWSFSTGEYHQIQNQNQMF